MPKGTPKRLLEMPDLTPEQESIINGSLLGDAWLEKLRASRWTGNLGNSCLGIEMSATRKEYLEWMFDKLKPFSRSLRFRKRAKLKMINGKLFHCLRAGNPYIIDAWGGTPPQAL